MTSDAAPTDPPTDPSTDPSTDLHVERDGFVATIEIRRPPNNFFDTALIRGLANALDDLATTDCRAVVLCAEGKHFCAGAELSGGSSAAGDDGTHLYDHAVRIFENPLPIVAAVQGAAIGGGLGLALAADFRVATPESRWAANFARLGFHHGFGLSVTLPRLVGQQHAAWLLYSGERIGGERALEIGLCDRLAGADELRTVARDVADQIAGSAPLAIRSIRTTLRSSLAADVREAVKRERSEQERLTATADFREGVAAMAERRTPDFTAR
jgi:2-(1,2-epoxy-1,2-dihydrophenyl)acetyl-CoA isomerase